MFFPIVFLLEPFLSGIFRPFFELLIFYDIFFFDYKLIAFAFRILIFERLSAFIAYVGVYWIKAFAIFPFIEHLRYSVLGILIVQVRARRVNLFRQIP